VSNYYPQFKMKKLVFSVVIATAALVLTNSKVTAQTFQQAVTEYHQETGAITYQGQPLQPMWFKVGKNPVDLNGDGEKETNICHNEFWLFGVKIWEGKETWPEPIPGKH